jgi:hypothetical protein
LRSHGDTNNFDDDVSPILFPDNKVAANEPVYVVQQMKRQTLDVHIRWRTNSRLSPLVNAQRPLITTD